MNSLGGSNALWNPVLDLLAERREVIAVEIPGFGDSPPLDDGVPASARNLAAAVLEFVDSLGLRRRPGVAGVSLGGWTAIECGRQGGAEAVVALSPAGFWPGPLDPGSSRAHHFARSLGPLVPLLFRSEAVRRRALAANVHRPERVPLADAIALVQDYGRGRGYPAANEQMRAGTVGDLADLEVPLTIAWAEFDRLVRNRPLPAGVLPKQVRELVLPGCGHLPTWDDPELVARVILEGTAEHPAGAGATSGK